MESNMIALLSPILPWLGAGIAALVALLAAWLHGRASGVKSQQPVVAAAQAQTAAAQAQAASATADVQAAVDATQAVQDVQAAQQQAAAIPSAQLDSEAQQLGIERKG
jgi:hypothetical protein